MKNASTPDLERYRFKGYIPTIGIECHVQLKTDTKLFAAVSNDARGAAPNSVVSHVCFGLPGALPVLNEYAVELAARAAFALGTRPQLFSKFDRKHYFYPDLPKGYQISQFDQPIILGGEIPVRLEDGTTKVINITRAHMEEDAGKSTHPTSALHSLVDLNRAGTPLLEIVSEPEMHNSAEAKAFAKELWLRMKYAGVSDVDLYHGNMRFDVNVSVSKSADSLGTRSETKNLNSFRSVERAISYEVDRQIALLQSGGDVVQETRGWLDDAQETVSQRSKEDAHDYRYFPDPDLPPIVLDEAYVSKIEQSLSVLPDAWRVQLSDAGIETQAAETLLEIGAEFDDGMLAAVVARSGKQAKAYANWVINIEAPLRRIAAEKGVPVVVDSEYRADVFEQVWTLVSDGKLSSNNAKQIIEELLQEPDKRTSVEARAEKAGYIQVSDTAEIEAIVQTVLDANPQAVVDIKQGETKVIGFLVGQVMKASKGAANPALAKETITRLVK